jgi:hypothetical protein
MAEERPDLFNIVGRDREITAIRERLARLESEKAELEGSLNQFLCPAGRGLRVAPNALPRAHIQYAISSIRTSDTPGCVKRATQSQPLSPRRHKEVRAELRRPREAGGMKQNRGRPLTGPGRRRQCLVRFPVTTSLCDVSHCSSGGDESTLWTSSLRMWGPKWPLPG